MYAFAFCISETSCFIDFLHSLNQSHTVCFFYRNICCVLKHYEGGRITVKEVGDTVWKNFLQCKLTFLHWNKGEEMAPTIGPQGGTLLVRKIPIPGPR